MGRKRRAMIGSKFAGREKYAAVRKTQSDLPTIVTQKPDQNESVITPVITLEEEMDQHFDGLDPEIKIQAEPIEDAPFLKKRTRKLTTKKPATKKRTMRKKTAKAKKEVA